MSKSTLDWEYVNALLGAIHGAATAGPKYANLVARAEAELNAHVQENPVPPAVEPEASTTAPPAALTAVELPASGDGEPEPDATAPTLADRRV